jgi:uncharacterized protein (UPF0262 family)
MADKAKKEGKKVTVTIGEQDFDFTVSINEYNQFVNDFLPQNKVAPAYNFAMRCVKPEQSEALAELLDEGLHIDVANLLAEKFKPAVQITVKK